MYAETIVNRAQQGGMVMNDFPKAKDVMKHLGQASDLVVRWTEKAVRRTGRGSALPATIQNILVQTFKVCREEVRTRIDGRLRHYADFVGSNEQVSLSNVGDMRLDTAYVMYEVLTHNYQTLVPLDHENTSHLARKILQLAVCKAGDKQLANNVVSDDLWAPFEAVIEKYLITFVEVRQGTSGRMSSCSA